MAEDTSPARGPLFPAIPRAYKFGAASVAELSHQLAAAGPDAELAVLHYVSGGLLNAKLRVLPKNAGVTALAFPDINDAHPCPPFDDCGGG